MSQRVEASSNISICEKVLQQLAQWGVEDIIICAGARNAPFVVILEKSVGFNIFPFFEERSASFFALGMSQRKSRPVAVVTTSGTAVSELVSAAVEATYTQTPLIFLTADRPRSYRGTGAPQAIEQVGIFSRYVETCLDIESLEDKFSYDFWSRKGPLQLNVCLKEPLIDREVIKIDFAEYRQAPQAPPSLKPQKKYVQNAPLVIAGSMSPEQAQKMVPVLLAWGAPIYAEALSNLRGQESIQHLLIRSGDSNIRQLFIKGMLHSVIRIGGIPTLRFWRDLEEAFSEVSVVALSEAEFTGLSRPSKLVLGLENFSRIQIEWAQDFRQKIFQEDEVRRAKLQSMIQHLPQSEISLLDALAKKIEGNIYIGNSLPIREWDLIDSYLSQHLRISGNRGANGIDGQISSFLGGIGSGIKENWGIFGDLTTLYDLTSLAFKPHLPDATVRIVVMNNSGGMIFKEMFQDKKLFLNEHRINFFHWAQMFGFEYLKVTEKDQLQELHLAKLPPHLIIEICPDAKQSQTFWSQYRSLL